MEAVLKQNNLTQNALNPTTGVFGAKIGFVGKIFGCWHKELTRPFTVERGGESYRACVECGARRRFDTKNLKTFGGFYYPPAISLVHQKR